jgi:ribonuclease P protein component
MNVPGPDAPVPPTATRGRYRFTKDVRLRRRPEFLLVQDRGHKISADVLLALVLPQGRADAPTRLGLTVSTKVGNSVVRNRIRRRLRELFRARRESLPKGLDMVLIARASAARAEWPQFVRSFDRVVSELKSSAVLASVAARRRHP